MARSAEVAVRWKQQLQFEGEGKGRPPILVDGDSRAATSPVEMLLLAAATCTASDVVIILQKQRIKLQALAIAGGSDDGHPAGRAQLTLQLLVNPTARNGMGLFAGLGAACSARRGSAGKGWLAVLLGLEAAPGRRNSWYVELGLAGGARVAAGWRLRKFPVWWR